MPQTFPTGSNRQTTRKKAPQSIGDYVLLVALGSVVAGMLFSLYVVIRLDLRHDEKFALQQLAALGYVQVELGERGKSGSTRYLPTATHFKFSGEKGGVQENGHLVCCALFEDLGNQRCGLVGRTVCRMTE